MFDPRAISVVSWDLDDTLYDRREAWRAYFARFLAERGLDQPEGDGRIRLEAIMDLDRGGDGDRIEFCRRVLAITGGDPREGERTWAAVAARLPEYVRPDAAAADCLLRLWKRYRFALISNGNGPLQRAKLTRAGVAQYFHPDQIFISGEVGFDKPDARIFERALAVMGKRPEEVLHVGDHPVNDIVGAAAAGMRTCWVSRGRPRPAGLPCDVAVTDTHEVAALLFQPLA